MAETKTKILVVLNYYLPYRSGLSEYARLVSEALATDFEITILTGRHERTLPREEVIHGMRVVRSAPLFFLHKGYFSLQFFGDFLRESKRADVIHLHLPMLEAGLFSLMKPKRTPLVTTFHCEPVPIGGLFDLAAVRAASSSAAVALRASTKIIVTSEDYAAACAPLKRNRSKWVAIAPPTKELKPAHTSPAGPPRIGFLGRFVKEKGLNVLLDAIPLVLKQFPAARFVLAGDSEKVRGGSERKALQAKIDANSDALELPGLISEDKLAAFYQSLNLFVLPSVNSYEAFGMVQVEAMKAGVPVVTTNRPGIRVPIKQTKIGELVPAGDSTSLAAAICTMLGKRGELTPEAISKKAYKEFNNANVFEAIGELYEKLARL